MNKNDFEIVYLPGIDGTGLFNQRYYAYLREMGYSVRDFTYNDDVVLPYIEQANRFFDVLQSSSKKMVVIGESFGGPLAAHIAEKLGDQCIGLGQIVTFHHSPIPCAGLLAPLMDVVPVDWVPQKLIQLWFRTFTSEPEHLELFEQVQKEVPKSVFHQRARETLRVDTRDIIRNLQIPIGVLHAKSETILLNSSARNFAQINSNASETTIEGSHLLLAQKPLDVATWTHCFIQHAIEPCFNTQYSFSE